MSGPLLPSKLPICLVLAGLCAAHGCGSSVSLGNRDAGGGSHGDGDGDGDGDGNSKGDGDGDHSGTMNDGGGDHSGQMNDASSPGDGDQQPGDGDGNNGQPDAAASNDGGEPMSEFDPNAIELCRLVNEYRVQNGLAAVPMSRALMTVAQDHVDDLKAHGKEVCSMHAWSTAMPDVWRGCCYDPAHPDQDPQCMWEKPGEITANWGANKYTGYGYEDASSATSPQGALDSWKGSTPHNNVILNKDIWSDSRFNPWPAFGCAVNHSYSVLWFGDAVDPQVVPAH